MKIQVLRDSTKHLQAKVLQLTHVIDYPQKCQFVRDVSNLVSLDRTAHKFFILHLWANIKYTPRTRIQSRLGKYE